MLVRSRFRGRPKPAAVVVKSTTRKQRKENKVARVKDVKRLINANLENKYLQGELTFPAYTDTQGFVYQINIIGQGVDVGQRVGDEVRFRNLDMRFQCVNATTAFARVRTILFWYRQEGAALPSAVNLLATNSVTPAGTNLSIISQYNKRTDGSYQIIYDKVHLVTSTNSANSPIGGAINSGGGLPVQTWRIVKNLKKKIGVYSGPINTDPMMKGFLGLLILSDAPTAAANAQKPQCTFTYTLTYEDA